MNVCRPSFGDEVQRTPVLLILQQRETSYAAPRARKREHSVSSSAAQDHTRQDYVSTPDASWTGITAHARGTHDFVCHDNAGATVVASS